MLSMTPSQIAEKLPKIAEAGLVANLIGPPGIGKTQLVYQFAKKWDLESRVYSLSQREPTDLLGFPSPNPKTGRMQFYPDEMLPLQGDKCKGKTFVLFFDEMNACARLTAAAAYRVIQEKKSGKFDLYPNTIIIAAGNRKIDKAITTDVGTAMQSRLVNIEIVVSVKDWLGWANLNKIDTRVISFIKFRRELLHKFNPDHNENNFPCPRTWHHLSDYIKNISAIDHGDLVVMGGTVGAGAATEFKGYCNIYSQLPSIKDMKANPAGFVFKKERSHYFALTSLISAHFEEDPNNLMIALERMPVEMQVVCLREAIARNFDIFNYPVVEQWAENHSESLY